MDEVIIEDPATGLIVSNLGRVWSPLGRQMKGSTDSDGYTFVHCRYAIHNYEKVHRIVARNFIQNPNNLPQVNHKDENRSNNKVDNLEWCDAKYNVNYGSCLKKVIETKIARGQTKPCSIIKDGVIKSSYSIRSLAKMIGVDRCEIRDLRKGKKNSCHGYVLYKDTGVA